MEDGGLGSLLFYLVLAAIGLIGSFKGKKKVLPRQTVTRRPAAEHAPDVQPAQKTPQPVRSASRGAQPVRPAPRAVQPARPAETIDEGHYNEPMAGTFSSEGSLDDELARMFEKEGSISDTMAGAFASEGSIADTMAAAFASEGVSSLNETQAKITVDNAITDGEIHDAPGYDYSAAGGEDLTAAAFDLRKAVVYSAVLSRKEYGN